MAERNRLADDAERYERQAAFDFARANVRLEGFVLDAETEALAARYVAGEISCAEFTRRVQASCGLHD